MKFSFVGRKHLADGLNSMRGDMTCAEYSIKYLRPIVRGMILNISSGARIIPEFIRVVLSGCLKVAALKAVVHTLPSKAKGLRIQSSDIILGEPGLGKGQAFQ